MKLRSLYILSIVGLFLVVVIQLGGMMYAYDSYKKEAKRTLDECFRQAFIETVDNQINNLPFPDYTIPFYSYIPKDENRPMDNEVFLGYQQAASFLQDVYQVTIPLDEMERTLEKKLKWKNIDRTVWIDAAEDHSQYSAYRRFKTVVSDTAWLNEKKGEAIEAAIIAPFLPLVKDIFFLFLPTLLLTAFLIYSWAQQMKYIISQRRGIEEQRSAFYTLAEKMRQPIGEVRSRIRGQRWEEIETSGKHILDMTEETLSAAKEEEWKRQARKQHSFKIFFIISLLASCLLMVAWFVYLYRTAARETVYQVNDCFEAAFYDEVMYNRYPLFRSQPGENRESEERIKRSESPFAEEQREYLKGKEAEYTINILYVVHTHNTIDQNYRLRAALIMQKHLEGVEMNFQYLDSAFAGHLSRLGMKSRSGIRQFRYPSDSTVAQSGYTSVKYGDYTSRFIPLREDSTLCVQGVVKNPYRYVATSIWYLLLPLWITFLVMLDCIFGQVKVLRMQHRLEQFQKDFTYAMIHDMKSPLNSILMAAHVLAGGKLADKPEKEEKYRRVMTEESEHLLVLSNRVLMLTQLDEGHLELHKEEVVLRSLLDDLIAKISLKSNKKVEFNTVYHRCETVYADVFCLREVLGNLLDNAIKYSREEVKIDIICESERGACKIKVCDNGLGISLKDQSRIFNRFERSAAARSSKGGATGFGLGLNYVQQVMLAHEGRVEVESEEARFSEFTLYFPVRS
ncbi:HAMP domain-containing sensor histidine kinase [uncultured Bacteroides sp.]|uniref:sensor histidine kinase n=1 Tax=uncultured Bacteroides sp. TaxID=162156 RepID=UPI002638FDAB|nr:HAMP domain-containing sensor histidine kinase [uncultured Bacteroides sp.]